MYIKNFWLQYAIYINTSIASIIILISILGFYSVVCFDAVDNNKSRVVINNNNNVDVNENLFGVYVPQITRDKIHFSNLNYKVTGILFSKDKPYAMISIDGGDEKVVTVGDFLDSYKIYAIKDDYVVMLIDNKLERLNLDKPKL